MFKVIHGGERITRATGFDYPCGVCRRGASSRPLRVAVGIAYYPSCAGVRPSLYAPALVLTGALDDWTPAAPCAALRERSQSEPDPIAVTVYADAHHAFDFRGPRSIDQWGKTLEHNVVAPAGAERRVDAFLRQVPP